MKKNAVLLLVLATIFFAIWLVTKNENTSTGNDGISQQATPSPVPTNTTSINGITFSKPDDFALATNTTRITVKSVIPPCDENFDYCMYYNGNSYQNTNFESAGVRIKQRTDLLTNETCLSTQPDGYSDIESVTRITNNFDTSTFAPLGDAGAGHASEGELHRLSFDSTCYEFETRIGTTNIDNYDPGTITEFTDKEKKDVENKLLAILRDVRLSEVSGVVVFP